MPDLSAPSAFEMLREQYACQLPARLGWPGRRVPPRRSGTAGVPLLIRGGYIAPDEALRPQFVPEPVGNAPGVQFDVAPDLFRGAHAQGDVDDGTVRAGEGDGGGRTVAATIAPTGGRSSMHGADESARELVQRASQQLTELVRGEMQLAFNGPPWG